MVQPPVSEEITELFRKNWTTYQKLLQFNNLHHNEIIAGFSQELQGLPSDAAVLDIGVGDAWLPTKLFSLPGMPTELRRFTGVDTTGEALSFARSTARIPATDVEFVENDMSDYMRTCPANTFDVIMSSYAIHHLDTAGKAELLKDIYRCLKPDGIILWGDVYNYLPGTTRDEVMIRWKDIFMNYQGLTLEERQDVFDHVSTYDLPEDLHTMHSILEEAGFTDLKKCYDDGYYTVVLSARKSL